MKTRVKFSKQILSVLLCLAMLMSYVPAFSLTAHAATTNAYDGTPVTPTQITSDNYATFGLTADNWSSYDGYYGIRTAAELYGFANLVNSSKNSFCAYECAVLLADIVVNSGTVTEAGSSSGTTYDWTPIGLGTYDTSNIYGAPYFAGTFDGNGHTISGLYCNTTDSKVGLFGSTGYSKGATIKNVIIANSYFGGSSYVGGIVGYAFWNTTNITNCKVSSDVTVKGTDNFVGGILGGTYLSDIADDRVNDNEITNCVNFGTVKTTASTNAVGGIAGSWAAETDYQRDVVSCTNCYYLANCASNASGTVNWACGTYATGTGWADNTGCTALDSANASHNHINVTHKEVKATCLFEGLSSYSFCLICDTETSGTKTVYGIDADNHSSHSLTYKEHDEYTHNVYHTCCDALLKNATHNYTGGNCVTSEVCSLCKRVGNTCPDVHASAETVVKVMPEDTSRHATYHKCCSTLISGTEAGHTYVGGVCSVCAYNCQHKNIVDGHCDACGEGSVKYLHREWNGTQVVSTIKDTSGMPTIVTSDTTTMSSGWYIVYGNVTVSQTITVNGTVHLILADDAHLNAKKGIKVENNNAIYIYSQSAETGRLTATSSTSAYYHGVAGIGSHSEADFGTIVINGGIISTTGGKARIYSAAAGIGGSGYRETDGHITINGGMITATGSVNGTDVACGIGGGAGPKTVNSCTIVINGGTITTNNGIGGSGGSVTITGGNINSKIVGVTPKDKDGNTVSQQPLTVNGAANNTPITELEGVGSYGLTNVVTLNDKLYFYLPSGVAVETITAGGGKYNCNSDNTFYKEHSWVEANCFAPKHCSKCGITEGTALVHNYVNGVCENCGIGEDGHFYISNVNHLMAFAAYVNFGNKNVNAMLLADIDLDGYTWDIICETGLYYNGYGEDLGYAGTFDGNGHVIKNISVKSSTTMDASCGLFGTVSGTIKNLGIEGFTFVDGGWDIRTGAIVGQLITTNGRVENCYVKNATIKPGEHVTGGIAGCVYDGTIENCYVVESDINGTSNRYGYIVGDSRGDKGTTDRPGTVENCYTDNSTIRSNNVGNITDCATKSANAFASGEVTYLLNGKKSDGELVWYQTLTEDAYPKFEGSVVYYDATNGYNNHVHTWKYETDGTTITATCTADDCTNTDGGSVKLVAKNGYYTGGSVGASVEGAFTNGATYKVTYGGSETAPSAVGTYTATLIVYENGTEKESVSAEYKISYLEAPESAYIIKGGYKKDNTYYFKDGESVTVDAPTGYEISKTLGSGYGSSVTFAESDNKVVYLKRTSDGAMTKAITISETMVFDGDGAIGKITITNRGFWEKLFNRITFGLFFKGDVVATVTADDSVSGVASIQYYVASEDLINNGSTAALHALTWTPYEDEIALNKNAKNVIYIKITDNVGNVTYLSSEGIVLYSDAEADTKSVSTTYKVGVDKEVTVKLNGNTVKEIKNGTTVVSADNYTVSADGKITLKGNYLDTLNAGTYTFTVSYNPLGLDYVEAKNNEAPATTNFKVVIEKAEGNVSDINISGKTYDGTPVSAPTYDKLGDGVATIEYKVKGADDSTYTTTAPSNAGTYVVRVTVAEGANYKEAYATAEFEIKKAGAEIDDNPAAINGLVYNGNPQALVTAGSTDDGIIKYSLDGVAYSTSIPEGTNAGTYTVYVKIVGDENHNDSDLMPVKVKIGKATVTEPTIASKPYTGSAQTADVFDTVLYTVERNDGNVARGRYEVVLKLRDADNYKWSTTDSAEVTLTFEITKAENTWSVAPSISGWSYGEDAKAPTYEAKFGNSTVKVTYTGKANDGSDYSSETAPTKAGNYKATFTVEDGWDYNGLSESVDFTIAKATYDMSSAKWNYTDAFKYDGKEHKVEVVGLPSGVAVGGYNGNTATVVGDYTAKVTLTYDANNYNAPSVADLNWKVENNWTPSEYTVNGNDWMNQDFVITANNGYKVSLINTADGEWKDSLTYSAETDNGSVTFYLKNETDGTISLAKTVTYKLDKTAPTGKVEFVDRTGWQEFVNTITFGLFYKDEVTVKITSADNLSGVAKVEYYASNEGLTLDEVKAITDWTAYSDSFGVSVEDTKKFVYYVRITDNAGNVTYLSTDGAEYDITAPVISGIESGATYYTTQKVTVTDKNLNTVTLNGNVVNGNVTLDGNKDVTYTIVATDKAGNSTTVTVTMKPISDLSAPIDALNKDNVNSGNEQAVDGVKTSVAAVDTSNATDDEKAALKEIADKAAELEKVIDDTKAEIARIDEELNKHNGATVTSDDKADLEQLLADIEKQLESTNLTEEEISELNGDKKAVEDLLTKIKGTDELIDKLTEDVNEYSDETVKSTDKDAIEQIIEDIDALLETENLTDDEKKALEDAKDKAEGLLETIDGADKATDTENTEKVKDITAENVTPEDKTDLEKAKADLEKALDDYGDNYTDDEKKAIEDEIKRIDDALEVIENVENVEELIGKIPENITKNDEAAIKVADDAYNALTDYEKSLVDEDAKKALDDAKAALAELNKPTDSNSPQTGDNSNHWLWFALLFVSGAGVFGITLNERKRRTANKR